jgi:hypothetical protein
MAAKVEGKFKQHQLVNVMGRNDQCRISWPMVIQMPSINNGIFCLDNRMMYKLSDGTYAWEEDITAKAK